MVDPFLDWATVGVAVATVLLLLAAVWAGFKTRNEVRTQLGAQDLLHRQQRMFDLQSRLSSREFVDMSAPAIDLIELFNRDAAAGRMRWERTNTAEALTVLATLNFYELVAAEYNADTIDRRAANVYLGYAVIVMWWHAKDFVEYLRSENKTFFVEWKYFIDTYEPTITSAAREHLEARQPEPGTTATAAVQPTPQSDLEPRPGTEPTLLPLMTAAGTTLALVGLTTSVALVALGLLVLGAAIFRWIASIPRELDQMQRGEDRRW